MNTQKLAKAYALVVSLVLATATLFVGTVSSEAADHDDASSVRFATFNASLNRANADDIRDP